jgi:Bacteriocin-protection, YdeI or OmpD-Associated/Domain of unknown function (DUF1905)
LIQFRAVIQIRGINPYVLVDATLAGRLKPNWRRPIPVLIRIDGQPKQPWRINMMPAGDGSFYLYLHESVRKASGTKVGDSVTVQISFDPYYRGGPADPVPPSFQAALKEIPAASRAWRDLIPSRKKEVLRYFAALKSPEARERNLQKLIAALSGDEVRFMARTWRNGR